MKFEAGDQPRLVEIRVLAVLLDGALGVGGVPVVLQAAASVVRQHVAHGGDVVAGQVEQVVDVRTRDAGAFDDVGVLDVGNPRSPVDVERRTALPEQPGLVLHLRPAALPAHRRHDADLGALDHGVGEQRQVGEEFGEGVVEAALDQDFVELLLRDFRLVFRSPLRCVPCGLDQVGDAVADRAGIGRRAGLRQAVALRRDQLLDGVEDFRGDFRVFVGAEAPGALGPKIDVAQQGGRAAALHRHDAGVHFRAAELADFLEFGSVIRAVEHPHGAQQALAPARRHGVAMPPHDVVLRLDVAGEGVDDLRIGRRRQRGAGFIRLLHRGGQLPGRHHPEHAALW